MFRGIAKQVAQRSFATVHATSQPSPIGTNQKSIWKEKRLRHLTKVPQQPVGGTTLENSSNSTQQIAPIVLNEQTVRLLERLSLVNLDSKEAYKTLQDSIEFASKILHIETDGVDPLYSVLEQRKLTLRPDEIDDGDRQDEVLKNATLTEEEYFIAPPGNIPLEQS